jgi:hypothetical protein
MASSPSLGDSTQLESLSEEQSGGRRPVWDRLHKAHTTTYRLHKQPTFSKSSPAKDVRDEASRSLKSTASPAQDSTPSRPKSSRGSPDRPWSASGGKQSRVSMDERLHTVVSAMSEQVEELNRKQLLGDIAATRPASPRLLDYDSSDAPDGWPPLPEERYVPLRERDRYGALLKSPGPRPGNRPTSPSEVTPSSSVNTNQVRPARRARPRASFRPRRER